MSDDRSAGQRAGKPKKKKVRRMAKKLAVAQGKDWAALSDDDKKALKAAARGKLKSRKAARKAARTGE
jgi:hypothetical protein